jgi:hypothetical protein
MDDGSSPFPGAGAFFHRNGHRTGHAMAIALDRSPFSLKQPAIHLHEDKRHRECYG